MTNPIDHLDFPTPPVATIVQRFRNAWKAVVAVVAPILSVAITETLADLQTWATAVIAGAVTGLTVYLKRNIPLPEVTEHHGAKYAGPPTSDT